MVDIVLLTGLVSVVTQYFAIMLTTLCIVDFFSYRTIKTLYITLSYLFLLPTIFVATAYYFFSMYGNSALWQITFKRSFSNLLTASAVHLFSGLLIIVLYLRDAISRTKSLAIRIRDIVSRATMRVKEA